MDEPRYEFDPAKDTVNREKHGVSLSLGIVVLEGMVAEVLDPRPRSEERFVTFGLVGERLYACVWTRRGGAIRIISVRKAHRKEQLRWLPEAPSA